MSLHLDNLHTRARALARTDDFWGEAYKPALQALTDHLSAEAALLPNRLANTEHELVDQLVQRARMADLLRRRPEILDQPLPAPLVITGLPRSGTTLLHNLLTEVPGLRGYRLWELRAPVQPPEAPLSWSRRQLEQTQMVVDAIYTAQPRFRAIHPLAADAPDECNWLLRRSFLTPVYSWTYRIPGYERWRGAQDPTWAYAEHRAQLQALRWRSPGGVPVLKDPGHLWALPALIATYPDVRILRIQRDNEACVPSMASLSHALWSMGSQASDTEEVGRETLRGVEVALRVEQQARATHPERFIDLSYGDLVADPVAFIGELMGQLDLPFDDEGAERARTWLRNQQRTKGHRYSLADFGLTSAQIQTLPAPALS